MASIFEDRTVEINLSEYRELMRRSVIYDTYRKILMNRTAVFEPEMSMFNIPEPVNPDQKIKEVEE